MAHTVLGKHRRRSKRSYRVRKQHAQLFWNSNTYIKVSALPYK